MRHLVLAGAAVAAALLVPDSAEAQRRPARRQPTIEIRGQVPTPQVVTVRPRAVPTYSRRVLTPNFYDRNFWPSILPGYQLVSRRAVTGASAVDSAAAPADSTARPAAGDTTRTTGTPPAPKR